MSKHWKITIRSTGESLSAATHGLIAANLHRLNWPETFKPLVPYVVGQMVSRVYKGTVPETGIMAELSLLARVEVVEGPMPEGGIPTFARRPRRAGAGQEAAEALRDLLPYHDIQRLATLWKLPIQKLIRAHNDGTLLAAKAGGVVAPDDTTAWCLLQPPAIAMPFAVALLAKKMQRAIAAQGAPCAKLAAKLAELNVVALAVEPVHQCVAIPVDRPALPQ